MNWKILFDGFVPQRKCEKNIGEALLTSLAPAGLSAVGSIASSLFGQSRQAEENQKNRDFALEMWNRNNEYNTPKAQRERLEAAGYNPYLLTQDASASGNSVQSPSPSSSPLPGFDLGLEGASRLFQNGIQLEANVEEQHASAMEKIYGVLFDAYEKGGQELYDKTLSDLRPTLESFNWEGSRFQQKLDTDLDVLLQEKRGRELDNQLKDKEIYSKELDNQLKGIENKWRDKLRQDEHNQFVQTLKNLKAECNEINSRTDLNKEQKRNLIAQRTGTIIENGLKGLDFQNQKEAQKEIQEALKKSSKIAEETIKEKHENASNAYSERRNRDKTKRVGPWSYKDNSYDYDLP